MYRDNIGLLEGIGGQCTNAERFRDALHREIEEEVGTAAVIEIDRFSHLRLQHDGEGASGTAANWIVVFYICGWRSGPMTVTEPTKIAASLWLTRAHSAPRISHLRQVFRWTFTARPPGKLRLMTRQEIYSH
ncbi:NUDIX hydrolase [Agrobacterium sp. SOY23]|uniref:NUDIX hydrolase n=1 Tax=Agrobacterium sp. SOY23 TaxID=3014555 RepID=UPI003FA48738